MSRKGKHNYTRSDKKKKKDRQKRAQTSQQIALNNVETSVTSGESAVTGDNMFSSQEPVVREEEKSSVAAKAYQHISNDLRFVGILAAVMFAALVILTFVL